jgi:hypothetical protein
MSLVTGWDEISLIQAIFDGIRSCTNTHDKVLCKFAPTLARRAETSSCLACPAGTYSAAGFDPPSFTVYFTKPIVNCQVLILHNQCFSEIP